MKFHRRVNIMNVLIDALGTSASFTFPITVPRNSNKFQYLSRWKYRRDIMIKWKRAFRNYIYIVYIYTKIPFSRPNLHNTTRMIRL